ncbi:MAG: hypothetical protein ACRENE_16045, partial [Polyangiaceae bacterium]
STSSGSGSSSGSTVTGCGAGGSTTISGTVFDPAGQVPLPNVWVYVPVDPATLPPITTGTKSCSTCPSIGRYYAATQTNSGGAFSLSGLPASSSLSVALQVGKWRRVVTVNIANQCGSNPVASPTLRLPRNRSEGDIPQMAVLTGGADDLGCFLRAVGLDASEYGAPQSGGRLDVYQGVQGPGLTTGTAGACGSAAPVCPLWSSKAAFENYDIALLACEGGENGNTKPVASLQAMRDWLDEGGKVLATHFHYYWFKNSPQTDFQNVATWTGTSVGAGSGNYTIDTGSPGGTVFDQWLSGSAVSAATGTTIALTGVADSVSTFGPAPVRWVYDGNPSTIGTVTNHPKMFTFVTPIGGTGLSGDSGTGGYCGKVLFTDLHTSGSPSASVPGPCPTTLTAQQKALEYLFFDLSACVSGSSLPPAPPPSQ